MVHRESPCIKSLATTAAIKISHRGFRRFAPTSPPACGGLCQKKTKSSMSKLRCFLFSFGGERGIRTPGTGKSVRQFSKLLVSATHPSHRIPIHSMDATHIVQFQQAHLCCRMNRTANIQQNYCFAIRASEIFSGLMGYDTGDYRLSAFVPRLTG